MDNAPSHITADLVLTNVTLKPLPPNTTSKVQPMDAGIIAAFKRHYRRLHLQSALDRDEAGETNLYKVDQLTAMRWSLLAWSEVSSTTIESCFRHTGLMDRPAPPRDGEDEQAGAVNQTAPVDQEKQAVEEELE